MSQWFYLETGSINPAYNLAMEEVLVETVSPDGPALFVLWQNSPSVIIGRHQNARAEVNFFELERRNISLVRRLTGGGAVYHDLGNLNYSFIWPQSDRGKIKTIELIKPLIEALRRLGVQADLEGRNDLSLPGLGKFSGLAGRQWPGKYQLHGTILFDVDLGVLEQVLLVDPEKYKSKGVASVRARVVNLKPFLKTDLAGLWAGLKEAYGARPLALPASIKQAAEELAQSKYLQNHWNIGQSPPADIFIKKRFAFGSLELHLATNRGKISAATITGDFLTLCREEPGGLTAVSGLEEALIDLPAHEAGQWAAAWSCFDLRSVFYGPVDNDQVLRWLAKAI